MTFYPLKNAHLIWWGEMTLWWVCPQTFWRVDCTPGSGQGREKGREHEEGEGEIESRCSVRSDCLRVVWEWWHCTPVRNKDRAITHYYPWRISPAHSWTIGQQPLMNALPVSANWIATVLWNENIIWSKKEMFWKIELYSISGSCVSRVKQNTIKCRQLQ